MQDLITKLLINEDDNIRQQIAKEIADLGSEGVDMLLDMLRSGSSLRVYLLTLSRIISKDKCRLHLIDKWKRLNYRPLLELSKDIDPKIRKSAYVIMGEIPDRIIRDALIDALEIEETIFLVPSIILALGNMGDSSIRRIISNKVKYYQESLKDKAEQAKSLNEIIRASDKTIDKLSERKERHSFVALDREVPILLTTMDIQDAVTLGEAEYLFDKVNRLSNYIEVITDDYQSIYRLRTFYEALISFTELRDIDYNPNVIVDALKNTLTIDMLNNWHKGVAPYRYRIELKGEQLDRAKDIDNIVKELNRVYHSQLINSISDYEIELRIEVVGSKCSLYIKLYTYEDNRFNYRINSLPASIKAETAAICLRLVRKYLKDGARVLDPFVGTGTMLIERNRLGKDLFIDGVDVYNKAIEYAEGNTRAARVFVNLYKSDILEFENDEMYDEIISNMPYGLRVGTHKDNETLYFEFMKKIPSLLKKTGYLILLTADYNLLKDIAFKLRIRLLEEYVIYSGGLTPHLFVFRCN